MNLILALSCLLLISYDRGLSENKPYTFYVILAMFIYRMIEYHIHIRLFRFCYHIREGTVWI